MMLFQDISSMEVLLSILCCIGAVLIYLRITRRNVPVLVPVVQEKIVEKIVQVDTSGLDGRDHQIPKMKGPEIYPESMYTDPVSDHKLVDQKTFTEKIQESFKIYGLACLIKLYWELQTELENLPLRIAVTGRSGVGKSSFINTLRGVTAESKFAADTGVTETTRNVKEYRHPEFKQMVFCDLPGVGTKHFPKDTYLTDKTVAFKKYDMFIILTSSRVFDDDIWLAKEAKKQGKCFLFVRTQVDLDIYKERMTKPTKFKENVDAEALVLECIRSDLENQLKEHDIYDDKNIFLLDSNDLSYTKYDYESFNQRVLKNFPALKREALMLLLTANTSDLITKAVESNRTWFVPDIISWDVRDPGLPPMFRYMSLIFMKLKYYCTQPSISFALLFTLPIPFLPTILYLLNVPQTIPDYRNKVGLTDEKLKEAAKTVGKTLGDIEKINIRCVKWQWNVIGFLKYISIAIISDGIKWASVLVITYGFLFIASLIIGSIISFIFFLWASVKYHDDVLDVLKADALKLDAHFKSRITDLTHSALVTT